MRAPAVPLLALLLALLLPPPAAAGVVRDDTRSRPTLDGEVRIHDTDDGRFRIHYTLDGGDALPAMTGDEEPVNGVPDAIDAVVDGLDTCWQRYVEEEGWRPPGEDGVEGGDGRLDVYLRHIDNNGLAHQEWHGDHWAAYLEIEPDLTQMGWELLASVAAHELHHAIQYAYAVDTHSWVHESSATYAQYRLYGEPAAMAAALQLLWSLRLEDPGIGLDQVGDRLEYASLIWVKYLVDRQGGDPEVFRRWWELLEEDPDWRISLEALADELGEPGGAALAEGFAEWLYFACARDDGQHWLGGDGLDCIMPLEASLVATIDEPAASWQAAPDVFGTALATVVPQPGEGLQVRCEGPADADWGLRGVPLDGGEARGHLSSIPGNGGSAELLVDDPGDEFLVVIAYYDGPAGGAFSCEVTGVETDGGDDDDSADSVVPEAEAGCACRAPGARAHASPWAWLLVLTAGGLALSGRRGR